jgi:hypothetical protein
MIKTKTISSKPFIDLQGSQGNAFYLMGVAKDILKQLKRAGITEYRDKNTNQNVPYPSEKEIIAEFMSSDYENLINSFDKYFGEFCDLVR